MRTSTTFRLILWAAIIAIIVLTIIKFMPQIRYSITVIKYNLSNLLFQIKNIFWNRNLRKFGAQVCAPNTYKEKMKTENKISVVSFVIAVILFIISRTIKNDMARGILCITGIVSIITSIVFERKAKNPQNFGIFATLSKIVKSRNNNR